MRGSPGLSLPLFVLLTAAAAPGTAMGATGSAQKIGVRYQSFVGAHISFGQGGPGLGLDADVMAGPWTWLGDGQLAALLVAGPFLQLGATLDGGPALAVGARGGPAVAGFGSSPGFLPVGMALAEVGYAASPKLQGLRVGGRLRSVVFDVGFSGTRNSEDQRWSALNATGGLSVPVAPSPFVVDGRPLRIDGQIRRPVGAVAKRHAQALQWLRRAEDEAGAALAFARLAGELAELHAPAVLRTAVHRAALEERQHTVACLQRAAAHGEGARLLVPPTPPPRPVDSRLHGLARVAWEAHWDGHDNEGRAAQRAAKAATNSRDPREAQVEARIAKEEHGHALLGAELTAWAVASGGAPVCRALAGGPVA